MGVGEVGWVVGAVDVVAGLPEGCRLASWLLRVEERDGKGREGKMARTYSAPGLGEVVHCRVSLRVCGGEWGALLESDEVTERL